jgi:hypothetical protein
VTGHIASASFVALRRAVHLAANSSVDVLPGLTIDSAHGSEQPMEPLWPQDRRPAQSREEAWTFSAQLDELQQHVAKAKSAVQAAATESREQLRQRIDQAQVDIDQAAKDAQQQAGQAAASAKSKWAQMKADASARMDDVKAKIDQRNRQLGASAAASDADWAESDATAALDYAEWTVDNARLAMLDAIDARAYADERARRPAPERSA